MSCCSWEIKRDSLLKNRERCINMSEQKKKELLLRNREYKRKAKLIMTTPEQTPVPTISPG